ncbi:LytR family transcriptional regulator [Alkalihalobacillus sp. AL-G]|uniref:LCP family glycopolymer transferase n=1 Tax=Alkalihalobacillus sp. AL-G TaxID=2926399 RepID=UPI002729D654|nr:LytR family transcriptional regulator [Alkalihalobacillus sp. AL-G]WLD93102.1 LytR family transcriptional regulator [Alkalihalobacillus sp. AL-G]
MIKKLLIILASLIGIVVIGGGAYAYYLYDSVKDTAREIHEPIDPEREATKPRPKVSDEGLEPISILLMGVDERPGDRGRSDTMIVITVNPKKESMYMFNIPRDTRTLIVGRGYQDKINHAYAFGGTKMAVETVENFLDIPIDYYFKVNMQGFKDIVDAVGGVTVKNEFSFTDGGNTFEKGEIHLTGKEALSYVRMRKKDPDGDLGRNERQRQVIKAVIDEGASVSSLTKFDDVLDVISENVKTNMTFEEMTDIQANYKEARKNMKTFEVDATPTYINDIFYFLVSEVERNEISEKLQEHLGMETGGN